MQNRLHYKKPLTIHQKTDIKQKIQAPLANFWKKYNYKNQYFKLF